MKLKTQKKVAAGVGAVAGVTLLGYGLVSAFENVSFDTTEQTPATTVVEQAAPVSAPLPPVVVSAASTIEDNQETVLAKLQAEDKGVITGGKNNKNGVTYEVKTVLPQLGKTCLNNAKTDGAGYQGLATSISYGVVRTDKTGAHPMRICFNHDASGKRIGGKTAELVEAASAPKPQPQLSDQNQVLSTLQREDKAMIARNRKNGTTYEAVKVLEQFGGSCLANGKTDETGYHGYATSIAYGVNKTTGASLKHMRICVNHDESGKRLKGTTYNLD